MKSKKWSDAADGPLNANVERLRGALSDAELVAKAQSWNIEGQGRPHTPLRPPAPSAPLLHVRVQLLHAAEEARQLLLPHAPAELDEHVEQASRCGVSATRPVVHWLRL